MRKMLYGMLLLGILLFTGCNKKPMDVQISASAKAEGVSEVVLYEEHGFTLNLKAVDSIEGNRKVYVAEIFNSTDKAFTIYMDEIVFNDIYVVGETEVFYMKPLEGCKNILEEMAITAYTEGIESIHSIEFHLSIRDENYQVIDDCLIDMDFVQPIVHAVDYNLYKDAKAETQILEENESVKLTLIEWGKNPDNNHVTAVVCIENASDQIIPATITGMMINGVYFRTTDKVNYLKPGQKCYAQSYLLENDIENAGIKSIEEVALMILSDEAQNTGTHNYVGGVWYPIQLSEKGVSEATLADGELLDNVDGIEVFYLGMDETQWSEGGYYTWNLRVVNGTDEHARVGWMDVFVNGVPYDQWKEEHPGCDLYIANGEVGANANRAVSINLSYDEKIARPEISFKFHIRSIGGSSVLGIGNETIFLMNE